MEAASRVLRAELLPVEMSPEARAEVVRLIAAFEAILERRDAEAANGAREALCALTGHEVTEFELRTYWSAQSLESFVDRLSTRPPRRVEDITRVELVEIVRRAMPTDPAWDVRHEAYWAALFELHVTQPRASSLIYYPPDDSTAAGAWDPTAEEVVDLALAYEPLIVPA